MVNQWLTRSSRNQTCMTSRSIPTICSRRLRIASWAKIVAVRLQRSEKNSWRFSSKNRRGCTSSRMCRSRKLKQEYRLFGTLWRLPPPRISWWARSSITCNWGRTRLRSATMQDQVRTPSTTPLESWCRDKPKRTCSRRRCRPKAPSRPDKSEPSPLRKGRSPPSSRRRRSTRSWLQPRHLPA